MSENIKTAVARRAFYTPGKAERFPALKVACARANGPGGTWTGMFFTGMPDKTREGGA